MILGILSDTHTISNEAVSAVVKELISRGAKYIIHCGDLDRKHLNPELFGNLPVYCALNLDQIGKPVFETPPAGWVYTQPDSRIRDVERFRFYLGHKRAFDLVKGSEKSMMDFMDEQRKEHDGLRAAFSGHTHHQIFANTHLVKFINPGAVEFGYNGYEFATLDTENGEVVFSRIPETRSITPPFSVTIISDSLRISRNDSNFWKKMRKEILDRDAGVVIHCGNIALEDIGRSELKGLEVHYNLRKDQQNPSRVPENWYPISRSRPIVEVNGYRFYVQLDLGVCLLEESETGMNDISNRLRRKHGELDFILCGFTHMPLMVEQQQTYLINPGDIIRSRSFAVVCLPRCEITFGHVPV